MKAIAYVRVSTDRQAEEGVSLAAQEERIRAYCTMTGLDLMEIVREEGVSGKIALGERPAGRRVIELLEQHKAKHVITLKLDRLFRDTVDALGQTRIWDKAGIALHLVDHGGATINTASAMGRMFLTMMAGFAELERNLIAERVTTALRHKKRGMTVYNKSVPLGFQRTEDGRLVPCPEEQAIVGQIMAERMQNRSLHYIAKTLNAAGHRGRNGGKFYASSISKILKNDIYLHNA
ncbi:recombinase family protein [Methylobacterium sp. 1030]|uniref:recombinase family protein n=1 Tax=Methylobacterium sp. 1030 TaxID=3156404 RepID=UPI0033926778